jgi:hypothetical protein
MQIVEVASWWLVVYFSLIGLNQLLCDLNTIMCNLSLSKMVWWKYVNALILSFPSIFAFRVLQKKGLLLGFNTIRRLKKSGKPKGSD